MNHPESFKEQQQREFLKSTRLHFRWLAFGTILTCIFWTVYSLLTKTEPKNYVLFISNKLNINFLPQFSRFLDPIIPVAILVLLFWQTKSKKRIIDTDFLEFNYIYSFVVIIFGICVYYASLFVLEPPSNLLLGITLISVLIPTIFWIIIMNIQSGIEGGPINEVLGTSLGLACLWSIAFGFIYGLIIFNLYLASFILQAIIAIITIGISALAKWLKAEEKQPPKDEFMQKEALSDPDVIHYAYTADLKRSKSAGGSGGMVDL